MERERDIVMGDHQAEMDELRRDIRSLSQRLHRVCHDFHLFSSKSTLVFRSTMTCFPFVRYHFSSYLIFLIFYLIFIWPFRTRIIISLFSDCYLGLRRLQVLLQDSRTPSPRRYHLSKDPIEVLH